MLFDKLKYVVFVQAARIKRLNIRIAKQLTGLGFDRVQIHHLLTDKENDRTVSMVWKGISGQVE